jgi:hypothetical protein
MDTATIDQQYNQLQTEFQDVATTIQQFAAKLQAAAQAGDQNAREWLLDLKQIALDVKDEQMQVTSLLQAIHGWAANEAQNAQQAPPPPPPPQQQPVYQQPPPQTVYVQQAPGGYGYGGNQGGGMLGGFLNSGFGRAMEMGAGFAVGDDLINSIF